MGIQATYNGEEVFIGKRKYIEEKIGKLEINIENKRQKTDTFFIFHYSQIKLTPFKDNP